VTRGDLKPTLCQQTVRTARQPIVAARHGRRESEPLWPSWTLLTVESLQLVVGGVDREETQRSTSILTLRRGVTGQESVGPVNDTDRGIDDAVLMATQALPLRSVLATGRNAGCRAQTVDGRREDDM
jgi:hypothetical protein